MSEKPILVVEDNPDDRELIKRSLMQNNLANRIVFANDGVEALDLVFGTGENGDTDAPVTPALIMLDLKMPRLGGREVLERLRADDRTKNVPVVVLTSSDEERDIVESYKLGANSYVRKPVDFGDFSRAVKELGLYWCLRNEPPCRSD